MGRKEKRKCRAENAARHGKSRMRRGCDDVTASGFSRRDCASSTSSLLTASSTTSPASVCVGDVERLQTIEMCRVWLFIENLLGAVDTIIWSDSSDIKLYVYCDIGECDMQRADA